ncbi:MAG: cytochrome c [bacterium]
MTPERRWQAAVTALLAATLALAGCKPREVGRSGSAAADSSFAAVAFQRDRTPADLALVRGRVLYARYCAICHGDSGGGDGFNAYNLKQAFDVAPTAFTDSTAFAALSEDSALAAIRDGGPAVGKSAAMPPWGHTLTAGEVIDVWQYVRSLARAKPAG